MIEKARLRNPKNPELWLKSIKIELAAGIIYTYNLGEKKMGKLEL